MISQKRSFSILSTLLKSKPTSSNDLKPVFKQPHHSNSTKGQPQPQNFEKNLPQPKIELKPWEKQNISKDSFFKRKYGNISPQDRKALNEKVERQRRFRAMKIAHEKSLQEKAYQERERARELAREAKGKGKNFKSGGSSNYDTGVMVDRNDTIFDYVFGTHPVKAVLMAGKRRILDLYTFNNEDPDIVKLAMEKYGIVPKRLKDKNALNILCKNGVHNGVVLKTNKLDIPYIKEVGHAENGEYKLAIEELDDAAAVDDDGEVKVKTKKVIRDDDIEQIEELYPLSLYLDEITDPQNMGSILRSAYFFGVDFIVVPNHSTAKLGPVANKASAGALDLIDIYQTGSSLKFIDS
ncbi:21S rRNA ('-O)-methyltransferase, partial [Candida albicans GC75]